MVSRDLQHKLLDLTLNLIECGATVHFNPCECPIVGFKRNRLHEGDKFDEFFHIYTDDDCLDALNYLSERLTEFKEKDPGDGNLQRSNT